MEIINLYRYKRGNDRYTISPVKPDSEYTELYRLVADEGMLITKDGDNLYPAIDVDSVDGWYEVSEELSELELKAQAYDILIGEAE